MQALSEVIRPSQFPYKFPDTPFESIGFSLSGGGFRAAAYGLGVLSLLNEIRWEEEEKKTSLLEKVNFVSSASGGTITLSVYVAALHGGVSFIDYYRHLNSALTGETVVGKAIAKLSNPFIWQEDGKSRNIINAFAHVYHEHFFSLVPEKHRTLGGVLEDPTAPVHVEEACFNSSDFYTGVSFRFHCGQEWFPTRGGTFGNANIGINWKNKDDAVSALKAIRLGDVLAASSCFPMGFEPIIYPKDFSYPDGPSVAQLQKALTLETLSWDDRVSVEDNHKSIRAKKEREFAQKKTFGLMDGGILDNQGIFTMLLANERNKPEGIKEEDHHRFDLMLVSDVTSHYMSPYIVPEISTDKEWMIKTPEDYWNSVRKIFKKINKWAVRILWIAVGVLLLFLAPIIIEGVSIASVMLAIAGLVVFTGILMLKSSFNHYFDKYPIIKASLAHKSFDEVVKWHLKKESFTKRTVIKVVGYLKSVQTGIIIQMINARLQSSATMIGDVFLKRIRRLIYDQLFDNPRHRYRRLNNMIYKLTFTNNKNRDLPAFEPREQEERANWEARKAAFIAEVNASCKVSTIMQETAELAYSTGTAMWFADEQEKSSTNNRQALIATGQFTTCYNLLGYCLSLQHSRHFLSLNNRYQKRVEKIVSQLKEMMLQFEKNPYYLYQALENKGDEHENVP